MTDEVLAASGQLQLCILNIYHGGDTGHWGQPHVAFSHDIGRKFLWNKYYLLSLNTFKPFSSPLSRLPNVCLDVVQIPSNHSYIKYSSQDKTCHQLGILYSHFYPRYSRYLGTMCNSYNEYLQFSSAIGLVTREQKNCIFPLARVYRYLSISW